MSPTNSLPAEALPAGVFAFHPPDGTARSDTSVFAPTGGSMTAAATSYLGYTLRHSFSLAPSPYPVPYSCFQKSSSTKYFCRGIYGYEEGDSDSTADSKYDIDFLVTKANVKSYSSASGNYGSNLVYSGGAVYEGCTSYSTTYYKCDYWASKDTTRTLQTDNGYWVKILKDWASYTSTQTASCAAAVTSMWLGGSVDSVATSCLTAPFTPGT